MTNSKSAARLRSIILLSPFDYELVSDKLSISQLYDARRYRDTALVEKDSLVDNVLNLIRRNSPEIRFFE